MSPIVSPRSHETRRPVLRVLGGSERREPPTDGLEAAKSRQPALRIVPRDGREPTPRAAPVLLAGANARERAALRAEFGVMLPRRTEWVEASDVAGVLERAAYSRMVILAGDLDDADMESLMRLLGRRHPELAVIRVDASMPAAAGGRG